MSRNEIQPRERPSEAQVQRQHDPDAWWRHGVVYQIYPRSFQDSNGDGIGDLAGIRQRLGYLEELGVDAIWISPFYPSPMADFGYDVADYCNVDEIFGTLADFDALLADAHGRGMKVILDFVPNHTSDQHPWFRQSRRSRDSDLRDFYIWRDSAADGGPPNNWRSNFGGLAWTRDEPKGQWYYHAFLPQQPDLNWRNPRVRKCMFDAMRFWLARGVDGFRVDVIWHLIKDAQFRHNPPNPAWRPGDPESKSVLQVYSCDRPELMETIADMRSVVAEFDTPQSSRVLIGEIYLPIERLVAFYAPDEAGAIKGVQLPFNFHLVSAHWQAAALADLIRRYDTAIPVNGWPNWVLGNHDQPRIASRIGHARAALAAMLLLTLRGTPTLYYGDEIGMQDVDLPDEALRDPAGLREPGKGLGRDPERTPMPWDGTAGGGFSNAEPWLPLGADHRERNVEAALRDTGSMLSLYRALLGLRRREPALHAGAIEAVEAAGELLTFDRVLDGSRLRIEINFGEEPSFSLEGSDDHRLLFSTAAFRPDRGTDSKRPQPSSQESCDSSGRLLPFVGRILRLG